MMKRLKSIFVVTAIFIFGVMVGGVIGSSARLVDVVNKSFRSGPPHIRRILVQRAREDLKLDEDQSHQFWQILTETGVELDQRTKPVHADIEDTLQKSAQRLRAVLNPGQRAKFDLFLKDAGAKWKETILIAAVDTNSPQPKPKPPEEQQPANPPAQPLENK